MRAVPFTNKRSWLAWVVAGGVLAGVLALVAQLSWAWAESHTARDQLLPGTTISGVDVGGLDADAAVARLRRRLGDRPGDAVTVVHGDRTWTAQPAQLDATPRLRAAVETALQRSGDVAWPRLAWAHWLDGRSGVRTAVPLRAAPGELAAFADRVAADIDRAARDAGASWSGDGARLIEHRDGRRLDRDALVDDLARALRTGADRVAAEVAVTPAAVTTGEVAPLLPAIESSVEAALSRRVTVTHDGRRWSLTARGVGATPDMAATVAAHRGDAPASGAPGAGGAAPGARARLEFPEQPLAARVDELAAAIDEPARDAELDVSSGGVEILDGRGGRALRQQRAAQRITEALRDGDATAVSLPVERVAPEVTTAAFDDVLVLRQRQRRLHHYVDGDLAAQWPVAVGAGGSPTPTGRFTVGAKRHRPTWRNPDPDGWGSDMPDVIQPGPSNPLGLRALNWHQDGADTLIRFHGTADESSIGNAASQGCVRLTNADVVELYDRVPVGTPIVSIAG